MTEEKGENSFRSILKGTSIFGGVQVFNILVGMVRMKFVALLLGPAGMGVAGLFNSTSVTLQQFASLGLNLSVVKEIGAARSDEGKMGAVLAAIRPLIIMSALIGALICLFFPTALSTLTFGNRDYTADFMLLSAAVFFSIAGAALMSVLQGLHAVKPLSKASLVGSLVGLAVGVPLYWLMGTRGIVPAMVALSLSTALWYWMSLRKELTAKRDAWQKEVHLPILKRILLMGLVLMSNDLLRNVANYAVYVFVRRRGGMDDVGFYQSCLTMTQQYSAIVFTAMAMDYLPRLSAAAGSNAKMCEVVNRQIVVVGLLIAPVVCAVVLLAPWVIEILQSPAFLTAVPLLRWMALSVVLKALMYPLGYIVFAKDNRKLFFWMESVGANLLTLCLTCGGFLLLGLDGLGVAAIADCGICYCVYIAVNRRLYGYRMSGGAMRTSAAAILSCGAMGGVCFALEGWPAYALGGAILIGISIVSGKALIGRFASDRGC